MQDKKPIEPPPGLPPDAPCAIRLKYHYYWAGVLTLAFIAAYWIPLKGIVHTWTTNDDYSYGYLIPAISVYLFWDMRFKFKGLNPQPSWSALPLLVIFVLISIYGILGSSGNIARPAVPVLYILLVTFVFGYRTVKRFALPLGILIFIVPLPAFLDRTFGLFLKSVSSQLGGWLIRMSGLSVHVSGNVIELAVTQLQVVDACSGLRFVFPLVALGIVYAYFFEKIRWKQMVCVAATVPIAILTNGLRIGITGILTHHISPEMAKGFFHDFSGWAVFMTAFVFLFAMGRLLRLFPSRDTAQPGLAYPLPPERQTDARAKGQTTYASLVCLLLIAVVGAFSMTTVTLPPVNLANGISSFPRSFEGWNGTPRPIDPLIIDESGAEEAFYADYRDRQNKSVSLYIGYRSTPFLENINFFHSPTVCLPASGWKNRGTSTRVIPDVPPYGALTVTRMLIEQMGVRQLVYFWFQTKKWATHSKTINRFHLTLHAIRRDNTHDLFLRTITPIHPDESLDEAEMRMDNFVRGTLKTLDRFISENIEQR